MYQFLENKNLNNDKWFFQLNKLSRRDSPQESLDLRNKLPTINYKLSNTFATTNS